MPTAQETRGQRLRRLRKAAGLQQGQIAKAAGVSQQCVSQWEADAIVPRRDKIEAAAPLLGTDADYLLGTVADSAVAASPSRRLEVVRTSSETQGSPTQERMGKSQDPPIGEFLALLRRRLKHGRLSKNEIVLFRQIGREVFGVELDRGCE